MKIVDCKQGTPEWYECRKGVATASRFSRIVTAKTGKPSAQIDALCYELLAEEMLAGCPENVESYTSRAMQYGIDTEPEARAWYSLQTGLDVKQVGLCLSDCGRYGCSPDGLVGDDGGLELKCPLLKTHLEYLHVGKLPDAYKAQVHGSLIVTGRKWWDFMSYSEHAPAFLVRVEPDEYTDAMREALQVFTDRLAEIRACLPAKVEPAFFDEIPDDDDETIVFF